MKTTANYALKKPDGTDIVNIDDLNGNMDIVDTQLKNAANHSADGIRHITAAERTAWNAKPGGAVATTSANGLMAAADKVKLNGIAAGANNYVHPSSHPASMITGLPTSLPANGGNSATVNGHTVNSNVPAGAKFTDTVYTHPSAHPASMITQDATHRFATDAEKVAWNGKAPTASPVFTGAISLGRKAGTTVKGGSFAVGYNTTASGDDSHAEGNNTTASGGNSHAEGDHTTASGSYSHAEGYYTTASEECSHAEGNNTTASGSCSHAEGEHTMASGECSHAEGYYTTASEYYSHAEGYHTTARGSCSHAEGNNTTASGGNSHAEGYYTTASGSDSHAEGDHTTASNHSSHAGGKYNKAMVTGGASNNTTGDAFVIGNGTSSSALSNAFRVTYSGAVYGKSSYNSSGADYAEYFEWQDGNPENEDRVGYFVTMDGEKIKIANKGDYILGIVSGQPCIIGNSDEDWLGRWQHDEFDRYIIEEVDTPVTKTEYVEVPVLDEEGNETGETKREAKEVETGEVIHGWRHLANPDYDPSMEYTERKDRKEWSAVGMLGVLAVRDNGECQVNGFCQAGDGGIAVPADDGYRVIKRVTDNIVKVIFR